MDEAEKEMRRGLQALYLETAPEVVRSVTKLVDAAIREAEERGRREERQACAEIARETEKHGAFAANDTDDVEETHFWWGYRDAGEAIAKAIEAKEGMSRVDRRDNLVGRVKAAGARVESLERDLRAVAVQAAELGALCVRLESENIAKKGSK